MPRVNPNLALPAGSNQQVRPQQEVLPLTTWDLVAEELEGTITVLGAMLYVGEYLFLGMENRKWTQDYQAVASQVCRGDLKRLENFSG